MFVNLNKMSCDQKMDCRLIFTSIATDTFVQKWMLPARFVKQCSIFIQEYGYKIICWFLNHSILLTISSFQFLIFGKRVELTTFRSSLEVVHQLIAFFLPWSGRANYWNYKPLFLLQKYKKIWVKQAVISFIFCHQTCLILT